MNLPNRLPLEPLAYHQKIVRYLQTHEPDLWKWFAADRLRRQQNDAARLDLLKATYRIERNANPSLYTAAEESAAALGLDGPMTFYQSQDNGCLNASLVYIPGEAHIVISGPVLTTLTPDEVRCVLGHELLHFALLDRWPEYLIAAQLLTALTNDGAAQPCHAASARLFRLYTEVYCDRGSYQVTRDVSAVITALVKTETGTMDVSADSYLRQTNEIFQKGHPQAEGVTHPETFIRAKALNLWAQQSEACAMEIRGIIEGPPALEELDLLGQERVCGITRRLISEFLRPGWLRTEPNLAHARLFFSDFEPGAVQDSALAADLGESNSALRDYYCYVLLDLAAADHDLEEAPLAAALLLSDALGLGDRFRQLAAKELNLRKKKLEVLEAEATRIVAKAGEGTD